MCEHCWHSAGTVHLTCPPQYPEMCCQCGERRIRIGLVPTKCQHGFPLDGAAFISVCKGTGKAYFFGEDNDTTNASR